MRYRPVHGYLFNTLIILWCFSFFLVNPAAANEWSKYGVPVLDVGRLGEWDDELIISPSVVLDSDSYKMWYTGVHNKHWKIGFATSSDGINWLKYPNNPVIDRNAQNEEITEPSVLYRNGRYHMWYTAWLFGTPAINYTNSTDGINWEPSKEVLLLSQAWEGNTLSQADVVWTNEGYKIFYNGNSNDTWKIGMAESGDGINWGKYVSNPVFTPNSSEAPTSASPSVLYNGNNYVMFYHSKNPAIYINYATSSDGITWNRSTDNPVITTSPSKFDSEQIVAPTVILRNNMYQLWYSGYDGEHWRIGYATTGQLSPPPAKLSNKVIIIPGIFGSWNNSITNCTLESSPDVWESQALADFVYTPIAQQLSAIGKEPVIYYYDWRRTASDNVARFSNFLKSNATSSEEKFDVIAHSFGGLVAQAYLEQVKNEGATNRIHSLVTVGTPFQGSVKAYHPWAAGEIWRGENIVMKNALDFIIGFCGTKKLKDQKVIVHTLFPSIGNLQPRFPYFRLTDFVSQLDPSIMTTRNTWSRNTNFSNPYYGSNIYTVSGTNQQTLNNIIGKSPTVHELLRDWWIDGKPTKYFLTSEGDESVRYVDSLLPNTPNISVSQNHQGIINSIYGITAIFSSLNYGSPVLSLPASQAITSTLIFASNNTSTQITDPEHKIKQDKSGLLGYTNPVSGTYTIQTTQTGSDDGEIIVLQELSNGDSYQKVYSIPKNTKKTINISFDGVSPFK